MFLSSVEPSYWMNRRITYWKIVGTWLLHYRAILPHKFLWFIYSWTVMVAVALVTLSTASTSTSLRIYRKTLRSTLKNRELKGDHTFPIATVFPSPRKVNGPGGGN